MRLAPLLLALAFAVTAAMPCVDAPARAPGARAELTAQVAGAALPRHHHAPPSAVLKAPCPCRCGEHGPAAVSLGSLGVALLLAPARLPLAGAAAPPAPRALVLPRAPSPAIEKVPRTA